MPDIKASVGIRNGKQCYNTVQDQLAVINMLNRLPGFSGGTADQPLNTSPRWGICSPALYQAILNFQARYSCAQDGHIDPGGKTIRALNAALGDQLPQAAPAVGKVLLGGAPQAPSASADDTTQTPSLWMVDGLSLDTAGYVDVVGVQIYSGQIAILSPSLEEYDLPMRGAAPSAGASASVSNLIPALDKNAGLGIVERALKNLADNFSFSSQNSPSKSGGVCLPLGGDLQPSSFKGACVGFNISGSVFVGGATMWALFFGLPRGAVGGLVGAELLIAGVATAPIGLVVGAISLYQAKGVALISSVGAQAAGLSLGATVGGFAGTIG